MRILFYIIFLLTSHLTFSQEYFNTTRYISMEDGLSHYKVLSFYPAPQGMWIGTADGLNYYDGFNWSYWKWEDDKLSFKKVDFIHKDQNDLLWIFNTISTRVKSALNAIDILDPTTNQTVSISEKFGNRIPFELKDVKSFFEDEARHLYFFANQKLWRYSKNGKFENVIIPKGFEPVDIFPDGTFVGKKDKKIALVSYSGNLLFQSDYEAHSELHNVLGNSKRFIVWKHKKTHQLFERQPDKSYKTIELPRLPNEKEEVYPVYFDKNNYQFWLYNHPMLHMLDFKGNNLLQLRAAPRTACMDKNGNLWIGENGITIVKTQQQKFKRFLYKDPDINSPNHLYRSRGILEKDGHLFINTYLGPKKIDLSNGEITSIPNGGRFKFVVMKGKDNHLWYANREVIKMDENGEVITEVFLPENPNKTDRAWSMIEDTNGKIWIGEHGLSYVENGKIKLFEKYNEFTQLQNAVILALVKDKNGVIWVVSSEGLFQLDPEKGIISGYGKTQKGNYKLPSNKFQHMYQDAEGIYWLATEDIGLVKWNKATKEIKIYNEKHGFLSNNIYAVYEDNFGFLWMSSFNGLIRFDKNTEKAVVFSVEDGICENEFNRMSHYQNEEGHLYFGGQNGVTGVNPKDFLENIPNRNDFQLKVDHTSILGRKFLNDTFPNGSEIDLTQLSPATQVIDLEISGSDIFWTESIDLHYSLEQIENTKVQNASRNFISPDNHVEIFGMQPGKYVLKIKAVQNSGKQLGETLVIPINIAFPFFHTTSFWIGVLLFISVMTWGWIRFRTARLKKRKVELEKLVKKRTEQILKDQKTIKSQAEQIAEMREQLHHKDEIWLEQLQTIINNRLEDINLDLPSIIENLEIGRSQFFEKVKSLTKMTPNQYIQEMRLVKAKEILESGETKTVKEVAYSVGIRRPSYFSKLFKDRFGILPSEYFRNNRN